jgi:hypothetical protein
MTSLRGRHQATLQLTIIEPLDEGRLEVMESSVYVYSLFHI